VLGARWSEVDLDWAVWTVPAERMKAGREHRVPLPPAAVELLRSLLPLRRAAEDDPDPLVFPGQQRGRPLSIMAMAMLLRRLGRGDVTVHGFRSSFRDWAGEETRHAREVVEAALAHRLGDKAEQAYARGDLFLKRRALMEHWAAFCAEAPSGAGAPPEPGVQLAAEVQEPEPEAQFALEVQEEDASGTRPIAGLPFLPEKQAAWLLDEMETKLGRAEAMRIWKRASAGRPGRRKDDVAEPLLIGLSHWLEREKAEDPNVRPGTVQRRLAERVHKQAPGRFGNSSTAIKQRLYRLYRDCLADRE